MLRTRNETGEECKRNEEGEGKLRKGNEEDKGMEEILRVHVTVDHTDLVEGQGKAICMAAFSGTADGPYFQGRILPGGMDTQTYKKGEPAVLSARYMLEGMDDAGKTCRLFIENNGTQINGEMRTTPTIVTDSVFLRWMEETVLCGTVDGTENGVLIHIWRE